MTSPKKLKPVRAWALLMPFSKGKSDKIDSVWNDIAGSNQYQIFDSKLIDKESNKHLVRIKIYPLTPRRRK